MNEVWHHFTRAAPLTLTRSIGSFSSSPFTYNRKTSKGSGLWFLKIFSFWLVVWNWKLFLISQWERNGIRKPSFSKIILHMSTYIRKLPPKNNSWNVIFKVAFTQNSRNLQNLIYFTENLCLNTAEKLKKETKIQKWFFFNLHFCHFSFLYGVHAKFHQNPLRN